MDFCELRLQTETEMLRRNITKQLWDWKSIDHDYEKRGKKNGRRAK